MTRLVSYLGATFLLAAALSLYLTPFVRRGAIRFEVLDRPDGRFKLHGQPVPYLGGIAVYVSFLVALSLVFEFSAELLGLLLGATLVAMLGLFDDLRVLPARIKLAGQLLATWAVLRSDISIELVTIPPWLAVPLTVLWLVGISNALNILDVSDGLCGGV
ncbi:MAG: undecaprenyl/decaprenyl-phosphate alpha-N-acetylglucosaminyl 1-phosphate transferase, partial [Deltaproteobacteria bacterium]|nr:undecaprenyl/decaprenyl-phosphate alpha-N-acetylglucosaminyl 1-phosphate transferase [Deltaproteobacteria bacterium]